MSEPGMSVLFELRSHQTVIKILTGLVELTAQEIEKREKYMNKISEDLKKLSKDVELMKGGVPDDASLHLLAHEQLHLVNDLESWVERQGPRHPNPNEVVHLRTIAKQLRAHSEKLMGKSKESGTGINKSDEYRESETQLQDVPEPEDAEKREVAEVVPPAEESEKVTEDNRKKGWNQEVVG